MRIASVRINNFRSLHDVTIRFDAVTTLIGPNGTGKSTVLRALDWFFNGSKAGDLSVEDCSYGHHSEPISVEVSFSGLTTDDRAALGKYAPDDLETFTAWKIRAVDGSEQLSANAKGFSPFAPIRLATGARDKVKLYGSLRLATPGLQLVAASTGQAVEEAMTSWESTHLDQLEDAAEMLQTNFFGFNSTSKMSGLFDFVLVTADLRATEESVDSRTSIIGRILERSVDRTLADEQIQAIVDESLVAQREVYRSSFKDELDRLSKSLSAVVDTYSPGRGLKVQPVEFEVRPPKTTFNISILDGDNETPIERQGHGFQRTLLISALQLLAQSGSAGANGVICLAIEEPELYQHPVQAQAFAKVLRSLAEDRSSGFQVAYATHSPYFLEAGKFSEIRRLTRPPADLGKVKVFESDIGSVKGRLVGTLAPTKVDKQLDGAISSRLSVALFANAVVLVEGTTEVAVLHGVADRRRVGRLEAAGVAICDVGGKSSLPLAHAIIQSLGIPVHCVFDGDANFHIRAAKNDKDAAKIEEERTGHIKANRSLLTYFGLPPQDFPPQISDENVTVLYDHLEDLLAGEWPEWAHACSKLENEAGVTLSKNSAAYRVATVASGGDPGPILISILAKALMLVGLRDDDEPAGIGPVKGGS